MLQELRALHKGKKVDKKSDFKGVALVKVDKSRKANTPTN